MMLYLYILAACLVVFLILLIGFFLLDCDLALKFYSVFLPRKGRLNGKTVWIVGASTGIGEALAWQLAKRNCKLILTSTSKDKLEEVKNSCIERSKGNLTSEDILVEAYDITDYSKNDEAFKRIVEKFGDIDILISNAGKLSTSIVAEEKFEFVQKIMEINFFSHVYITKIVLKHWLAIKERTGVKKLDKQILVTSTGLVIAEMPFLSSYIASKQALNVFFRDVAMQHQKSDGVFVSIALPGPTDSEIIKKGLFSGRNFSQKNLKNMKTERCAHLMLVALANKQFNTWIMNQPYLVGNYVLSIFGSTMIYFLRTFGVESFKKQYFED